VESSLREVRGGGTTRKTRQKKNPPRKALDHNSERKRGTKQKRFFLLAARFGRNSGIGDVTLSLSAAHKRKFWPQSPKKKKKSKRGERLSIELEHKGHIVG